MRNSDAKRSRELSIMSPEERELAKAINPHRTKLLRQLAEMDRRLDTLPEYKAEA